MKLKNLWKRTGAALLAALMLTVSAAAAAPAVPTLYAFNTSSYRDVLSTLSSQEQNQLFQNLLCYITESYQGKNGYDVRSSSEADILTCLSWMDIKTRFAFEAYNSVDTYTDELHPRTFAKADFDRMTSDLFGRTLTFSENTVTSIPSVDNVKEAYRTYLYNGTVYFFMPQAGSVTNERADPHHLYQLKGNLYCADYTMYEWYMDETDKQENIGTYQAIVRRNSNGSWTLLYLTKKGGTLDDATLSAFQAAYNQPSDWAKAEVSAAQSAGLGVDLSGDPGWQDQSTRLQFAQVAVQMVEAATGQPLEAAPAGTFADCQDTAVLKAYRAGIVNGTGNDAFTPNGTITREALATMLWRAVDYLRQQGIDAGLPSGGNLSGYQDAGSISPWASASIAALNASGIMQGTSATTLSPQNPCTVEQSVLLAYRTLQKFQ